MRALLLFFQVSKLGEVFVQVDLVADGHDDIAEHGFVFAVLVADVGQFAFKAEDIGQDVFQLINHVVVGRLGVVAGPLQLQGLAQISQGEDVFGHGDKDQLSDLLAAVELLFR